MCTYQLSQDHLELFFGCIRLRGGWNNNPSALQFRYAYRALLVHADVRSPGSGNVTPDLQGTLMLRHQGTQRQPRGEEEEVDSTSPLNPASFLLGHDYANVSGLTDFTDEVLKYTGGLIVRTVSAQITCAGCIENVVDCSVTSILQFIRDSQNRVHPTLFVVNILRCGERVFRDKVGTRGMSATRVSLQSLIIMSFQLFMEKHYHVVIQDEHLAANPEHMIAITKVILKAYITLRLREQSRRTSEEAQGSYVRHILTKQILFRNQ